MALPLYLAMTAAEFAGCASMPEHPAWMACHFSPYAAGLSNCPKMLPEGSMLILNDRTPICRHDPEVICRQLLELAQACSPQALLLDLQRPGYAVSAALAKKLSEGFPCPVGVAEAYAGDLSCPVFLPPCPVDMALEDHIAPWDGREIWLDIAPQSISITLTEAGAQEAEEVRPQDAYPHFYEKFCCHYAIEPAEDSVTFHLTRNMDSIAKLLKIAEDLGITRATGLYQELGHNF